MAGEQIDRFLSQPNGTRPGLAVAQLEAVAAQVTPLQREDFPARAASQKQQRDRDSLRAQTLIFMVA
jgi:hypothetical protein